VQHINKELILNAVKGNVTFDCLNDLVNYKELRDKIDYCYGRRNRFLPNEFIEACNKFLSRDIDSNYFFIWLDFIGTFTGSICSRMERIFYEYYKSFINNEITDKSVRKIIHEIKNYDIQSNTKLYIQEDKKNKRKVIYLRNYENYRKEIRYIAYLVDHEKKEYDIRFIDESEIDFSLDNNYMFLRPSLDEDDEFYTSELITNEEDDLKKAIYGLYKRNDKVGVRY